MDFRHCMGKDNQTPVRLFSKRCNMPPTLLARADEVIE